MLARRWGRIIVVSSVTAERAGIRAGCLCGEQGGAQRLARTLAGEVSSRGNITANAVAPGPVRTELTAAAFELRG